jgi:type IV pilus assembly protein PilW
MRRELNRRFAAGVSLVELMVAMVIALIGTIIIFQVFEASEGIRRTTTSGGDAQQNGILALNFLENDLRNAGMGFNEVNSAGCTVLAYDKDRGTTNFSFPLVPVRIIPGAAANAPDQLAVLYGSQNIVASPTTITANQGDPDDPVRVMNRYGFRVGDLIVLQQPGVVKDCSLMEITDLPAAQSDQIDHNSNVSYPLVWVASGAVNVNARFNPNGGLGVTYTGANSANSTRVFNLGNLYDNDGQYSINGTTMPVHNTYAISANSLTVASIFSTAAGVPVADNIVHQRALYGVDDGVDNDTVDNPTGAGDGILDRWVDAATFTAAGSPWRYLLAVRVAVVARSATPERPSSGVVSDPCDTTTAAPVWTGSAWAAPASQGFRSELDLSADADWRCFRYRVFETTVPLRNWIWKSA